MIIKGLNECDFVNYKKPSMYIIFSKCDFKCDREAECAVCQNSALANAAELTVPAESLAKRYIENPLTSAIVFGGLEPFFDYNELFETIRAFRQVTSDEIVIYTGYTEEELDTHLPYLTSYGNIIVKFGRFIPNQKSHYDEVLGVKLASPNQYAKRL